MQQVGYINEAGKNLKVEFMLQKNRIVPKSKKDEEILISAWDINDEILEEFLDFINESLKENEARIALLTNTKEYQFFESEEIHTEVFWKAGGDIEKREEIESFIDEVWESAIFGCENLLLCPKSKFE